MTAPPIYRAQPDGAPVGAVLVVHEIFGLTPHIRSICDRLAGVGYGAVAPDFFADELHGACLPYSDAGKTEGLRIRDRLTEHGLSAMARAALAELPPDVPRIALGFCLGGTLAYLLAAEAAIDAAVGYYAVGLRRYLDQVPRCPMLLHFGVHDKSIPSSEVDAVAKAGPQIEIHRYEAGHAFNRDDDKAYVPSAATAAWDRTLAFLRAHARQAEIAR